MGVVRAILALVVAAAIVGMVTLNRGEPDHVRHDGSGANVPALRLSA
jgi:hypothetical protein